MILEVDELRKRIGLSNKNFDDELKETELSAILDLKLAGIHENNIVASDPLICQAITAYVRAKDRKSVV